MLLYGDTAKEKSTFRASVRADLKRKGIDRKMVKFKSCLKPAPPLCNRVASGWHKEPIPCYCHLWPPWLKQYTFPMSQLCRPVNGRCEDFEGKTHEVKAGQRLMYWRPGKKNKKSWHLGKLENVFEVTFLTGQQKHVFALNCAWGPIEDAHYVDPQLDIGFGEYKEDKFHLTLMQMHNAVRELQDPNAGLFPEGHVHSMDVVESEGSDMD